MANAPRGIETAISMKKTAAVEAASGATGWQKINIYSETFDPGASVIQDEELGGNRDNLTDPLQGVAARPSPAGSLVTALDLNQFGFMASLLLGAAVSVEDEGEGGVFTHTWESGQLAPGLAHFEMSPASGMFKMADAFTASGLSLDLADADGYRRATWTMAGRSVRFLTSAVSDTPAATPARDKLLATKGKIQMGASLEALSDLGNVLGGTFNLANGALTESYMDDSEWASAVEIGNFSCTLAPQIRLRSDQATLLQSFDGATPFAVRLLFQKSADALLRIDLPNVIANPVMWQANGVGLMDVSPTFLASQTASAPMCTVTVRNAISGYFAS